MIVYVFFSCIKNRPISDDSSSHSNAIQTMPAEQVAKLRSELDVVQTNAQVFGEMLITLQPGEEDPQDFELLMVKNSLMTTLSKHPFS